MKSDVPEMISIVSLMREYGLTYDEYLDTPEAIVEAMQAKLMVEQKLRKQELEKAAR